MARPTVTSSAYIGGQSSGPGGTGILTISGTGSLSVAGMLGVYNTSGTAVNLTGGTLTVNTISTTAGFASRFLNGWTGGTLNYTSASGLTVDGAGTTPLGAAINLSGTQTLNVPNQNLYIGGSGAGYLAQSGPTAVIVGNPR